MRQTITNWKSEPKLRKMSISDGYCISHSLQQASWVSGEMKFDAGGFVVEADVEGVQSIRTHSRLLRMTGVILGRKHGEKRRGSD